MMGLHQNYPLAWGAERMEGLTLDLGLDGMFSPLPTELNPVGTKESDPSPSWRYFGHSHSQTQQHIIVDDLNDDVDPCALLHSSANHCGESERKPDMFELSLGYPPQTPRQQHQLVNMKVEREEVERPSLDTVMHSLPEQDLASQNEGSFNCWRRTTELAPRKELHLYGDVGDEGLEEEFPDNDTRANFQKNEPDRCASSSVAPAAGQRQYPETIILTDDDTDDEDELLFEERCSREEDGRVSPPLSSGDSKRGTQESGFQAVPSSLPLRQIKQHVRSSRGDEDYSACGTPSSSTFPEVTMRQQYGANDLETSERNYQAGEQEKQSNPKRMRGCGDQDWLPSDLLDASHSERMNEAKRARGNNVEDDPQAAYNSLPVDVPSAQSIDSRVQAQIQSPVSDMNQAIQEMPEDTAEAFKELMRLVGASDARASVAMDDTENWCPLASDYQHNDPPPPIANLGQHSPAVDDTESRRSVANDYHHDSTPPMSENQASRVVDETDSRRSFSTGDFELNDSPPLDTVDQPVYAQGGPCDPSESASPSQCSPHTIYEKHAGKRMSNADVVLYKPKPEPVDSWTENNIPGSVVHVKQEQLHYQPVLDQVSVRPAGESGLGPCYANRKLILTALHTFEQVRQQIIKDPTYGQKVADVQATGPEVPKANNRRLRADLKAACVMRKKGFWLNDRVRPIGEVPGVTVGDCFRYRMEMAVIGLHRAVQAGIAVVPVEYSPYRQTVASSVVIGVSDPYQDDNDMGDTVVYSGQGGLCGKTKESQDQKLQRGNLALSNSYNLKLPVRLIRGHKEQNNKTGGILYSYDGLYQIVDMNYVNGVNGKKVYKFTMHRLPGQAPIFSGYPAPLGSQPPPVREPSSQDAVHWAESSDVKPLYLEKSLEP